MNVKNIKNEYKNPCKTSVGLEIVNKSVEGNKPRKILNRGGDVLRKK